MTSFHHQLVLADPARGDGHRADGEPGDSWRTCIANILNRDPETVPNFVRYHSFMDTCRRWLEPLGLDYGVTPGPEFVRSNPGLYDGDAPFIVVGRSPRGDWLHCVLMDHDLELVHDPHPSGDGILDIQVVELITRQMLWPRPSQLALTA